VKQSEGGKKTKFKCHAHCVSYPEFESTLLSNLSKLRPETVLPKQDEQAKQAKQLRDRITGLEGELGDIERQIENFFDQIGRTSSQSNRDSFEARIEKLKIGRDEVKIRKAQSETALEQLERGRESFTKWQADLAELKKAIAKDKDTRIRLKTHLKELIEKIEIFPKGDESNVEHCEALIEEYVPELERAKETYLEFRHYLRKRLLSRDGRFYKLHPRTYRPESECSSALRRARATGVPIAPESSLAFRLESREKAWKARNPKLDILFKEFFDGRRQGFAPKASRL
jgi:chromosome segregation ATPase